MTYENKVSIKSKFFHYVLPSVAAMWVYTIYTMVDGIFVARGVGKDALAAVNLSMPMVNLAFALGILLAVGASTKASVFKGRGENQNANRSFTISAVTVAFVGILVAAVVMLNLNRIALLLGATDATIDYVKQYLGIIICFVPFYMTSYNLEVLIKADGFPKIAFKTGIAGALTNVVLDALFVLVFHWGIAGAAVATGLSQLLTFSIYLRHFLSPRSGFSFVRLASASETADKPQSLLGKLGCVVKEALGMAKLGIADCVTELSVGVCIFIFNRVLLSVSGNDGVVIYTVISYFSQLVLMTMMGINQGTQPLISYYHGKDEHAFCSYIFKTALCCAGICSIIAFAIAMLFPNPIVGIYIDRIAEPELFAKGIAAFKLYSPAFLPLGAVITMMGYFTSLELPKSAMSISISRGLLFTSAFVLLLSFFFGEAGVWTAAAVSECFALMLALLLYRKQLQPLRRQKR